MLCLFVTVILRLVGAKPILALSCFDGRIREWHDLCHPSLCFKKQKNLIIYCGRICYRVPSVYAKAYGILLDTMLVRDGNRILKIEVFATKSPENIKSHGGWTKFLDKTYRKRVWSGYYYIIEIWWSKKDGPISKSKCHSKKNFFEDSMYSAGFVYVGGW